MAANAQIADTAAAKSIAEGNVSLNDVTLFNASGSQVGPAFYVAGLIAGTTGTVWMIVNEFKFIKNQRAINDMKLETIPGGIALKF